MTTVYLILFFSASSYFLLTRASSTAPKQLLVQVPSADGGSEIYGKNLQGRTAKVVLFEPRREEISSLTLVTDGRTKLVKSEYDHNDRLIDCEIIDNQADISRFVNHVEEKVERALERSRDDLLMATASRHLSKEKPQSIFDMEARVKACEETIYKRQVSRIKADDEEAEEKRTKRSYLIWPGTNWCGKGSKAEFADSYGPNKQTDQCCQKHDQCPYIIEGFTTRYNLFNYRVHTLSHCDCDRPFMDCLQEANTTTAAMVGKVYFNVVNTECFELGLQKTCARRSWWGGCDKYTTKWTATVKSLGNFPE